MNGIGSKMNVYLVIILVILIGDYLLNLAVDTLNVRHLKTDLPEEFTDFYDAERYEKAQNYLKENTKFSIVTDSIFTPVTIAFILIAGFNFVDGIARGFDLGPIPTGLIFAGILILASDVLHIPLSAYQTFVIEEKYGFNRTTGRIFVLDIVKKWFLIAVIGGIAFSAVLWFFGKTGKWAWLWCWAAITLFQLFLIFIAPVVIMPWFNKFVPLEEGELKTSIENYARSQNFALKGVFKMDGSRRSTKSNAFFTGFGRYRRIVLFDTLIGKHTVDELTSVVAHEMGHYRKKHVLKAIIISVFTNGLMFYILSLFINNKGLFRAFKMDELSIYASLCFFGFLYTPIVMIISILANAVSRKHEYEADDYAVSTRGKPSSMISALKKLSVDNLSNLSPHPLKVFLNYSHPPVLERIRAIRGRR